MLCISYCIRKELLFGLNSVVKDERKHARIVIKKTRIVIKKMDVKKIILIVFVVGIYNILPAQSLKNSDGSEIIRQLSSNSYELKNSGTRSYKIEKDSYWILTDDIPAPQQANHNGYCSYSNGEYIYYSRSNNIVAAYNPSQGRYYLHTAEGNNILKSASFAVLNNDILFIETGTDTPWRHAVDKGFDPVIIGFYLFSLYIIH